MKFNSSGYLVKEGLKNIWTNRMMSVASICVLLSCLVLIGSATMMFLNVNSLIDRIEDENVIMVYIKDGTDDTAITAMGDKLKGMNNVAEVEFVSKEKAWADQLKTMEDAQAKFFTEISTDIPLPDAYKVTVEDLNQFGNTVKEIKKLDNIDTIRQNTDLAKKLTVPLLIILAVLIIALVIAIRLELEDLLWCELFV